MIKNAILIYPYPYQMQAIVNLILNLIHVQKFDTATTLLINLIHVSTIPGVLLPENLRAHLQLSV
jgi:hypothetical protein